MLGKCSAPPGSSSLPSPPCCCWPLLEVLGHPQGGCTHRPQTQGPLVRPRAGRLDWVARQVQAEATKGCTHQTGQHPPEEGSTANPGANASLKAHLQPNIICRRLSYCLGHGHACHQGYKAQGPPVKGSRAVAGLQGVRHQGQATHPWPAPTARACCACRGEARQASGALPGMTALGAGSRGRQTAASAVLAAGEPAAHSGRGSAGQTPKVDASDARPSSQSLAFDLQVSKGTTAS